MCENINNNGIHPMFNSQFKYLGSINYIGYYRKTKDLPNSGPKFAMVPRSTELINVNCRMNNILNGVVGIAENKYTLQIFYDRNTFFEIEKKLFEGLVMENKAVNRYSATFKQLVPIKTHDFLQVKVDFILNEIKSGIFVFYRVNNFSDHTLTKYLKLFKFTTCDKDHDSMKEVIIKKINVIKMIDNYLDLYENDFIVNVFNSPDGNYGHVVYGKGETKVFGTILQPKIKIKTVKFLKDKYNEIDIEEVKDEALIRYKSDFDSSCYNKRYLNYFITKSSND